MPGHDPTAFLLITLRRLHQTSAAPFAGMLVEAVQELTGADAALLVLTDPSGVARVAAARGVADEAAASFSAPLDVELPARLRSHFGFADAERVMAVPLIGSLRPRGLLVARRPTVEKSDLLLVSLAEHAALALERIERERRVAQAEQAAARAAEEHRLLRAILDSLPAALWLVDTEGRLRLASTRARELSGNAPPILRPGAGLPQDRVPPLRRALHERVREEEWIVAEGAEPVPLLCSAGPLRDEQGALVGAVLLGQDLRRRKDDEARERELLADEEAGKARDVVFNALSHELRTPLAAILFALEVLQHPEAGPDQRERASRAIARNVQHQVRLIDDLLDLSRILRHRAHVEPGPLELGALVAGRVEAYREPAARAGLRLSAELPSHPVPAQGDAARLEQVVNILIENAIKFTDPGGSVEVSLRVESGSAVLSVVDSGSGIAPDMLPRLFQPLEQGERSLSRPRGGLGAGLAIARWIVEQHGGQTSASSAGLGKGSEFVVRLPLRGGAAYPRPPEPPRPAPVDLSARRVMVVEDNHDLLDTLLALLEMLGHDVVPAANATTALEAARRERPEIALIDIGLPDMDGYELARRLRSDQSLRGMRLVALTGYASEDHRQRALQAGFDDYLAKPVDMETIKAAVGGGQARLVPEQRAQR